MFGVPLNAMCSNMCAMPVIPATSSTAPTFAYVRNAKTGASCRSRTMNFSPFGSVNSWTSFSSDANPCVAGASAASAGPTSASTANSPKATRASLIYPSSSSIKGIPRGGPVRVRSRAIVPDVPRLYGRTVKKMPRMEKTLQDLKTALLAFAPGNVEGFDPAFTRPPNADLGDLAIAVFPLAKGLGKSPQQIAQDWAARLPAGTPLGPDLRLERAQGAGGFLNLRFEATSLLRSVCACVTEEGPAYGAIDHRGRHAGHGRVLEPEHEQAAPPRPRAQQRDRHEPLERPRGGRVRGDPRQPGQRPGHPHLQVDARLPDLGQRRDAGDRRARRAIISSAVTTSASIRPCARSGPSTSTARGSIRRASNARRATRRRTAFLAWSSWQRNAQRMLQPLGRRRRGDARALAPDERLGLRGIPARPTTGSAAGSIAGTSRARPGSSARPRSSAACGWASSSARRTARSGRASSRWACRTSSCCAPTGPRSTSRRTSAPRCASTRTTRWTARSTSSGPSRSSTSRTSSRC